ncbi:MAG: hypothetical protein ABW101_02315 [Candidatus Thiodiazotropha sp.]
MKPIQVHSRTEINPYALIELSESKESIIRERGEEWANGAVPALGKSLIQVAINSDLGEAVENAAIEVSMAAWLSKSVYRGIESESFIASNLIFTMIPDSSVKCDRVLRT